MKFSIAWFLFLSTSSVNTNSISAFVIPLPSLNPVVVSRTTSSSSSSSTTMTTTKLYGYLDDLSKDLYSIADNPDIENSTKEATDLKKELIDRLGPGDWSTYVEFNEFDGGDGQMGVAGDGKQGLEKFGDDISPQMAKSKTMSAKNAWGKSTGYAESLISKGMEQSRAQQLENWMNQQEILRSKNAQKQITESFDQVQSAGEMDWRALSKFGVERNQEFDMNDAFGPVIPGPTIEGVLELRARMNGPAAVQEFELRNEYMGFADFRAAFTADMNRSDWTITPKEGSLSSRDVTSFVLRFKPSNPGIFEGHLVIETEDFKKTWKLVGSTS